MKISNIKKYVLIAIFGISISCLMGSILAIERSNTRPIEDFNSPNVVGWEDLVNGLVMYPHAWQITGETIWDCEYSGYIIEKDLRGPWVEVTVHLNVQGATCWVWLGPWYESDPVFMGTMNYDFKIKFCVKQPLGKPLPDLLDIFWFDEESYDLEGFLIGWGYGEITAEGENQGLGVMGEEKLVSINMAWYVSEEDINIWSSEYIIFY
ncbi:MAG: hypothetical protein ACFE8N_13000 [Promethearchaeota archaeon]